MPYTVAQEIAKYQPYQLKTNNRISRNDDSYISTIKNGCYKYFLEKDFIDISSASRTRLNWKNSNQECEPAIKNINKSIQIKVKDEIFQLPYELSEIASEIKDSKKILDLEEDWDSEGALSIPQFVWERAAKTLIIYTKWIWENKGVTLVTPSIDALADGSIDIMWNGTKGRLLLNVRNSNSLEARFYCDNYGGKNKINGDIENLADLQDFFPDRIINLLK